MDNQKVVVILLLITIILSVASVVLFMSSSVSEVPHRSVVDSPESKGSFSLEILETPEAPSDGGGS